MSTADDEPVSRPWLRRLRAATAIVAWLTILGTTITFVVLARRVVLNDPTNVAPPAPPAMPDTDDISGGLGTINRGAPISPDDLTPYRVDHAMGLDLNADPLTWVTGNLTPIDADPLGVTPPRGAVRTTAFAQPLDTALTRRPATEHVALYRWEGDAATRQAVLDHYAPTLEQHPGWVSLHVTEADGYLTWLFRAVVPITDSAADPD